MLSINNCVRKLVQQDLVNGLEYSQQIVSECNPKLALKSSEDIRAMAETTEKQFYELFENCPTAYFESVTCIVLFLRDPKICKLNGLFHMLIQDPDVKSLSENASFDLYLPECAHSELSNTQKKSVFCKINEYIRAHVSALTYQYINECSYNPELSRIALDIQDSHVDEFARIRQERSDMLVRKLGKRRTDVESTRAQKTTWYGSMESTIKAIFIDLPIWFNSDSESSEASDEELVSETLEDESAPSVHDIVSNESSSSESISSFSSVSPVSMRRTLSPHNSILSHNNSPPNLRTLTPNVSPTLHSLHNVQQCHTCAEHVKCVFKSISLKRPRIIHFCSLKCLENWDTAV